MGGFMFDALELPAGVWLDGLGDSAHGQPQTEGRKGVAVDGDGQVASSPQQPPSAAVHRSRTQQSRVASPESWQAAVGASPTSKPRIILIASSAVPAGLHGLVTYMRGRLLNLASTSKGDLRHQTQQPMGAIS